METNKEGQDPILDNQSSKKTYICDDCQKIFQKKSDLDTHRRSHSGEKPFVCSQCGSRFSQKSNLTSHLRIHNGDRRFKCPICSKTFVAKQALQNHERVHTGERPHMCNDCGRAFADASTLRTHSRSHSGIKPFLCHKCSKSFAHRSSLNQHLLAHEFKCDSPSPFCNSNQLKLPPSQKTFNNNTEIQQVCENKTEIPVTIPIIQNIVTDTGQEIQTDEKMIQPDEHIQLPSDSVCNYQHSAGIQQIALRHNGPAESSENSAAQPNRITTQPNQCTPFEYDFSQFGPDQIDCNPNMQQICLQRQQAQHFIHYSQTDQQTNNTYMNQAQHLMPLAQHLVIPSAPQIPPYMILNPQITSFMTSSPVLGANYTHPTINYY